jgi:sulfur relay (sulfurtransferase) complex TusBCD TusD component (DsrE family)
VNITVIVNEAPWAGGLATTALRLVRAAVDDGIGVAAVYFRGEGVYHSISGGAADAGAPDLSAEWLALSRSCGFPLLLCSSDTQRRLPGDPGKGFRIAGLPEVLHIAADSDRVVTF